MEMKEKNETNSSKSNSSIVINNLSKSKSSHCVEADLDTESRKIELRVQHAENRVDSLENKDDGDSIVNRENVSPNNRSFQHNKYDRQYNNDNFWFNNRFNSDYDGHHNNSNNWYNNRFNSD
jgi:hypothetical protein